MEYKSVAYIKKAVLIMITIGGLFAILIPLIWLFLISIKSPLEAFRPESFWVFTPTFRNYFDAISNPSIRRYFVNSFVVASLSLAISMIIGVPAAFAFSKLKSRFKNFLLVYIVLARMIPPMIFIIPYFILYQRLNLINTRIGLAVVYTNFNVALVVWSMWTFFNEVPQDLLEVARIDGASIYQIFYKIFLPLSAPGLTTTAIICFLMSWNEFLFALILTRGATKTIPVGIIDLISYEGVNWGLVSSGAILMLLPMLLFAHLSRKYIVKGLLGGALKG
ncbi:ABC transporter permease [Candidatus Aerophobetes bacterium Ae_b3b]|nr:MAG: ABC transporter permease [Candidatus Aerophobetes bacterium Ae_b3b]